MIERPQSLRIRWINFWRNGVRGFLVSCTTCGRTVRVHHYRSGPRLHMCYCVPRGSIMAMTESHIQSITRRYNRHIEKLNNALPAEAAGHDRVAYVKWMTQQLNMLPMGGYRASDSLSIPTDKDA